MSTLDRCRVAHLHPTQITVGLIEVGEKRKRLRGMGHDERHEYLRAHAVPAVRGPEEKLYITDHHHLCRALVDEDIAHVFLNIEADYSEMHVQAFWARMDAQHWAHPIDAQGHRRDFSQIPARLDALVDDPYRSLAGAVRNAGGFLKTPTAFAEFLWADFFRRRIVIGADRASFDAAVTQALKLARSAAARELPGFISP